jgi:hypothetical protein
VTTQPPRSEPQLRGRSWGDARLRVARFLANFWHGFCGMAVLARLMLDISIPADGFQSSG